MEGRLKLYTFGRYVLDENTQLDLVIRRYDILETAIIFKNYVKGKETRVCLPLNQCQLDCLLEGNVPRDCKFGNFEVRRPSRDATISILKLEDHPICVLTDEAWVALKSLIRHVDENIRIFAPYVKNKDAKCIIKDEQFLEQLLYAYVRCELKKLEDRLCKMCAHPWIKPEVKLDNNGHNNVCIKYDVSKRMNYVKLIMQSITVPLINAILRASKVGTIGFGSIKKILNRLPIRGIAEMPCPYPMALELLECFYFSMTDEELNGYRILYL